MRFLQFGILFILCPPTLLWAQYAPAAGKPGTSALHKESLIFINWAVKCTLIRGWKNIADKDSGFTNIGTSEAAIGKAGENGVVSLGDSGIAICEFSSPLINGPGWDFAVFENSFDDRYMELAFVEVSSDGIKYFRFPCHSLSDTLIQTDAFGTTEPENINNLAGKYRFGYGTPFDLDDLNDFKDLDKKNITHVKIIDVIGSLDNRFASYDTAGRKVNDPWPTPFNSGGFDLDAIGVIHQKAIGNVHVEPDKIDFRVTNPINNRGEIVLSNERNSKLLIQLYDHTSRNLKTIETSETSITISGSEIPEGLYFLQVYSEDRVKTFKGIKINE